MIRPALPALAAMLLITACSREAGDPAAGGLTVGESEALDRAAARIDNRTPSPAEADAAALDQDVRAGIAAERGATRQP